MSKQALKSITAIKGIIRRRILLNYAVDPAAVQRHLPAPFRPKIHNGVAIAGICMIRLEQIRPTWSPVKMGISSENAAHRIAVEWTDDSGEAREGVYIPRRDTDSCFNHLAGGRVFPGTYGFASFDITDAGHTIHYAMKSGDGAACIDLQAVVSREIPPDSVFSSVAEASKFFEQGCDGFSPGKGDGVDGIRLCIDHWKVIPLEIKEAETAWFGDAKNFPKGSARLDHALLMRDIAHEWRATDAPLT